MSEDSDFDYESENEVEQEFEEQEVQESEPEKSEPSSEGVEKKSGYVDLSSLSEDVRKPIEGRFAELTRKASKAQLDLMNRERYIKELESKINKVEPPKEVQMPSYELAIENPEEFNRQNQVYNDSLIAKRDYENQIKAQKEQLEAAEARQTQEALTSYNARAKASGIDHDILRQAEENLRDAGLAQKIGQFILADEDGPRLVKELNSDFEELFKLSQLPAHQVISYIERNVRPRLAQTKKPAAPPPPKRVDGSRSGNTGSSGRRYY